MNAIEFVKKSGWKEAQVCFLNCAMPQDKWFMRRGELISGHDFDYLKQIVEAFELVESYGGLQGAIDHLNHRREYGLYQLPKLKQAIELVEKCNASD